MEKDPAFRNNSLEVDQYIDDVRRHIESSKNISPYRSDEPIVIEPVELVTVEPTRRWSVSYNKTLKPAFRPNKVTACEGIENPEIFENESTEAAAKLICAVCLVSADCLAYALKNRTIGVWGGTTEDERITIRKSIKSNSRTK